MLKCIIISILLAVSIHSNCHADYTGLVIIPTVDTVGDGAYNIEPQFYATAGNGDVYQGLLQTQFGYGARFEAGIDFIAQKDNSSGAALNFKYVFLGGPEDKFAAAVGYFDADPRLEAVPYLVTTTGLGKWRIHAGILDYRDNNYGFFGFDRSIGDRWTVMADYTSGAVNYSSVGFNYQVTERFGIQPGLIFSNTPGPTQFTVLFSWTNNWK